MFDLRSTIFCFLLVEISILIGFVLGRVTASRQIEGIEKNTLQPPRKFNFNSSGDTEPTIQKNILSIDDTVYVTAVTSDSLQKVGSDIGQTSIVEDDIGSSVSKLAHLKKK